MADRRMDLEMLPFKEPGFIGSTLFPSHTILQKTGTLYYSDIVADAAVQTGRTLGTAPTATAAASANTTFTAKEFIKRYKIPASEIALLGGLDAAQAKYARLAKRSVGGAIEAHQIALTFGGSPGATYDIQESFLKYLDIAKETVMDYADGRVCIFGARRTIGVLKRYDEIVERMKFTGVLARDIRDVRNISDEQLAAALGVDVVLAGPSTPWLGAASAYAGYIGVAVLPDPNVDADEEIQLGRTLIYPVGTAGAPENHFMVETYYSDDLKSEVVDVTAWARPLALNMECMVLLTGCDEENAVTTTAS